MYLLLYRTGWMGGIRFGQRGFDAGMGRSRYFGTPIEARFDRGAPTGRAGRADFLLDGRRHGGALKKAAGSGRRDAP